MRRQKLLLARKELNSADPEEMAQFRSNVSEVWSEICECNIFRLRGYKTFSFSTQLSTKFQLLIKLKYRQIKKFLALSLSGVVFIMLLNVKMPTFVVILTFISWINFTLS